ncbi:MAG: adenylyl-sulfate kinase [Candidatus Thorarchaeota archaeon]
MDNKAFLICLVGLPASGKTTFAKILKSLIEKKSKDLDVIIIDPDKIRQNLTSNLFDYQKEHIVRKENLKRVKSELVQGHVVISDDLNYYSSMRHDLKSIADSLNIYFFIIHIATPIEICLKWNEKRGEPIPNMVIKKINEKFDYFNKYKWDFPDAVFDLSQIVELTPIVENFIEKVLIKGDNKEFKHKLIYQRKKFSNVDNENLDKITRTFVGKLFQQISYLALKKRILKLRKNFVNKNKNKVLNDLEILKSFKLFLENNLNIQIDEDL